MLEYNIKDRRDAFPDKKQPVDVKMVSALSIGGVKVVVYCPWRKQWVSVLSLTREGKIRLYDNDAYTLQKLGFVISDEHVNVEGT